MTAEEVIEAIQKELIKMKAVFLSHDYDNDVHGWSVEDRIIQIQNYINDYRNREFKQSEPDPFA